MRRFYLTCGIAIKLLICTTPTEAAEFTWTTAEVKGNDGKPLAYFATNGALAQGNFRIGCVSGGRHIFLTTGKLEEVVGGIIPTNGFADIELYNGKPQIALTGRFAYLEKTNTVNFIAEGIDENSFHLIATTLMSSPEKLAFRIRQGSREKPGFMFATAIGVGQNARAAVETALRSCGFM